MSITVQNARHDGKRAMSTFSKKPWRLNCTERESFGLERNLTKSSKTTLCAASLTYHEKVLNHLQAIEDIPCIHFVDELLEQYPKAKVILTTRDIDSWERSVQNTIFKIVNLRIIKFMVSIDPVSVQPMVFGDYISDKKM